MRSEKDSPAGMGPLRHELEYEITTSDEMASHLEARVVALEEVMAARWPRSLILRSRLARELRASVAGYGWVSAVSRIAVRSS